MRSQAQLSSGSIYPMQSRGSKGLGGVGLGRVGSKTAGNFGEMELLVEQPGEEEKGRADVGAE